MFQPFYTMHMPNESEHKTYGIEQRHQKRNLFSARITYIKDAENTNDHFDKAFSKLCWQINKAHIILHKL